MSAQQAGTAHEIDIDIASDAPGIPAREQMTAWLSLGLAALEAPVSVALRIVDTQEMRECNRRYRDRDRPTNVLSFPAAGLPVPLEVRPLGDILVCAPLVAEEAAAQGIPEPAHWAHLLIHGALHLQGFDHQHDADAADMEAREVTMLAAAGFPNPYR
jgi:probable rRNA maturation factor